MTMRKYDATDPTSGLPTECGLCADPETQLLGSNSGGVETYVLDGKPVRLCLSHSMMMNLYDSGTQKGEPLPEWEGQQKRVV